MKGRTSNFVRTLAACVLAAGCATSGWPPESAGSPAGAPGTADLRRIEAIADSMAQAQIVTGRVPGMSIAVARDGQILFARGYGQADLEAGTAAHPNTVYDVGSIPKQFAAAALMRLAAQDRVSLDAPLTDYLPDFPVQDHLVTVRHLLNHTSGIAERSGRPVRDDVHSQWYRLDLSYREMMELWGDRPFVFRPGERYAYNNFGYYVLGEIISRAAGKPFHEHAERELLHPLGLDRTVHCDHRRIIPDRARGYELEDGRLVNARFVSLKIGRAHV